MNRVIVEGVIQILAIVEGSKLNYFLYDRYSDRSATMTGAPRDKEVLLINGRGSSIHRKLALQIFYWEEK